MTLQERAKQYTRDLDLSLPGETGDIVQDVATEIWLMNEEQDPGEALHGLRP